MITKDESRIALNAPIAYRIKDRELPQRLLGVLLWAALFVILWKFGSR
jgi:hypothetical protein